MFDDLSRIQWGNSETGVLGFTNHKSCLAATANDTDIFAVVAVRFSPGHVHAVVDRCLVALAVDLVQPYGASAWTEGSVLLEVRFSTLVTQHGTHHLRLGPPEVVVTHRTPHPIEADLHSSFTLL